MDSSLLRAVVHPVVDPSGSLPACRSAGSHAAKVSCYRCEFSREIASSDTIVLLEPWGRILLPESAPHWWCFRGPRKLEERRTRYCRSERTMDWMSRKKSSNGIKPGSTQLKRGLFRMKSLNEWCIYFSSYKHVRGKHVGVGVIVHPADGAEIWARLWNVWANLWFSAIF